MTRLLFIALSEKWNI